MPGELDRRLDEIHGCRICATRLPFGPRPVLQVAETSRLLIIGQAPGRKAHQTGTPFDDASGERLRHWLQLDRATFHDATRVAIVPMGFCFPGSGQSGDLPPRPECAPTWHPRLLPLLGRVRLTLLIGRYAQADLARSTHGGRLTDTVTAWREHLAQGRLPLPHPSPRNRPWLARHPWFETELLPELRKRVATVLAEDAGTSPRCALPPGSSIP